MQSTVPEKKGIKKNFGGILADLLICLVAPLAYCVSLIVGGNSAWAENYTQILLCFSRIFSRAIGLLPFSLAEFIIPIAILGVVFDFVVRLFRRQWIRAVSGLLAVVCVAYALFTAGWGIAYSRQTYAWHAGLATQQQSSESLKQMNRLLISEINQIRSQAQEDENGLYKTSRSNAEQLAQVQAAYDAAASTHPWLAGTYGNPKPVFFSEAMSHLQISGIYIPYTFEANVNMNNMSYMIPAVACHEAAHLRGWAREDEANYIGYLVGRSSGDTDFAYSGLLLGLIHSMNALAGVDMDAYRELTGEYHPGVLRDISANSAHWQKYEGKASEMQDKVNDTYLKANRQEDGVRSYGRMVDLMLAEYLGDAVIL